MWTRSYSKDYQLNFLGDSNLHGARVAKWPEQCLLKTSLAKVTSTLARENYFSTMLDNFNISNSTHISQACGRRSLTSYLVFDRIMYFICFCLNWTVTSFSYFSISLLPPPNKVCQLKHVHPKEATQLLLGESRLERFSTLLLGRHMLGTGQRH